MKFRAMTLCSGIGAPEVALHDTFGFVACSEIEKAPSAVLRRRFPDVPNLGDFTKITDDQIWELDPDVVIAGTPCQGFSVAGLRKGISSDPRAQLTLEFVKTLERIDAFRHAEDRPGCVALWENVPGVLSMPDNAFGNFIAALCGHDQPAEPGPRPAVGKSNRHWRWDKKSLAHVPKWTDAGWSVGPKRAVAWRVLDAQYFGLAQRRKRVFVVAGPRDFRPWEVLFERRGLRRDTAPSRTPGKGFAADVAGSLVSNGCGVERVGDTRGQNRVIAVSDATTPKASFDTAFTLHGNSPTGGGHPQAVAFAQNQMGEVRVSDVMGTLNTNQNASGRSAPLIAQGVLGDISHTLAADGFDASEDGTGRGTPVVAHAFDARQRDVVQYGDIAGTLDANAWTNGVGVGEAEGVKWVIRRLTPVECERLQGFPDGWTDVPVGNRPMFDGPRYKCLGNSMAVPVMRWIGQRLAERMEEYYGVQV